MSLRGVKPTTLTIERFPDRARRWAECPIVLAGTAVHYAVALDAQGSIRD
jgi:hypothetical protein